MSILLKEERDSCQVLCRITDLFFNTLAQCHVFFIFHAHDHEKIVISVTYPCYLQSSAQQNLAAFKKTSNQFKLSSSLDIRLLCLHFSVWITTSCYLRVFQTLPVCNSKGDSTVYTCEREAVITSLSFTKLTLIFWYRLLHYKNRFHIFRNPRMRSFWTNALAKNCFVWCYFDVLMIKWDVSRINWNHMHPW